MRRRPAPASLPVTRLPFLEGLRGIAALYVVFSHFMSMSDGRRSTGWVSHAPAWLYNFMGYFWYGNIAVAAFIVLSGFCLQLSLFTRGNGRITNLKDYFRRRAMRILPPYYAALAISVWVAIKVTSKQNFPPFTRYVPVTNENVLAHVFLYHNFNPAWMYKINGVMWSIAVEAQLYVLFPLLVLGFFKVGRVAVLAACAGLAWAVIAYVPVAPKLYPWYMPLFVLGMVSAHVAFRPSKRFGHQPIIAAILGLAALGGVYHATLQDLPLYVQDSFSGVVVACLCYFLTTTRGGPLLRILSLPPLVLLGNFSYSLYLMHHPIQQIVYVNRPAWVVDEWTSLVYLSTNALPIILVGTFLFHLAFERPFLPRRVLDRQDTRPHSPLSLPIRVFGAPAPAQVEAAVPEPAPAV